ncbi:MAG TPA: metallophosphoesterase, partial [Thermoanaerobaculia bacterium]|nr:metallophosphoesterase [Thermoanaerobaculia bacterium]
MPRAWDYKTLDFVRKPMVGWFDPSQLARTGIQAVLSSVFGSYADRREVQAALAAQEILRAREDKTEPGPPYFDYSDREDLWFDYIADVGDGFDSTYQMARQVAAEELDVPAKTKRGEFLIFGGDQVYPTASREEYQDRFSGVYRAALPWTDDQKGSPVMFAVPGNHDWYDGLTSFTRLFCQKRWIGGWKTKQNRSYFAIRLPNNWWIWSIDVQLASDVDYPQTQYFADLAAKHMEKGSKVILCTAEPSWTYSAMKGPHAYDNLAYFEEKFIDAYGHKHVVGLAGDLHTYARYESGTAPYTKQRFICGGGGAYLYPTHALPTHLDLPESDGKERRYGAKSFFPDISASKWMSWGTLWFPLKNWAFALFMGTLYLIVAWSLQSTSIVLQGVNFGAEALSAGEGSRNLTFIEEIGRLEYNQGAKIWDIVWHLVAVSPTSLILFAALIGGLIAFADIGNKFGKFVTGGLHAAAHVTALIGLMWLVSYIDISIAKGNVANVLFSFVFGLQMILLGGLAGSILMGLYLTISNRIAGAHTNEVFSCQSIPDYKEFLRFYLDKNGKLTIYPIGVKKVPRSWTLWMDANAGAAAEP